MKKYDLYYAYSDYLKEIYGEKVYKLPVNLPVGCPNRLNGNTGCSFCSEKGTGFEAREATMSVKEQLQKNREHIEKKYNCHKFIAYFQSFTNTYAPIDVLWGKYMEAACLDYVVGLAIGTRPDCLPQEVIELLIQINHIKPVTVELGLQTSNDNTAKFLNRGYKTAVFDKTVYNLREFEVYYDK